MARELVFTFKKWRIKFRDGDLAGQVVDHPETAPRISMALTCNASNVTDPDDSAVRTLDLPFHRGSEKLPANTVFRMPIHTNLKRQTSIIMALHVDTRTAFHVKADEILAEAGINVYDAVRDADRDTITVRFLDMAAKASNASNPYHKGELIIDEWDISVPEDTKFVGDRLDTASYDRIVDSCANVVDRYYHALGISGVGGVRSKFGPVEERLENYHVPYYAASLPTSSGDPVMLPSSYVYDQKPIGDLSEEAALRLLTIGLHDMNMTEAEYLDAVRHQRLVEAGTCLVNDDFVVAVHATIHAITLLTNSYPYAYDVSSTRPTTAWTPHSNHFRNLWSKITRGSDESSGAAFGEAPSNVTAEKDHAILAPLGDSGLGVDCEDGANMVRAVRRQILDMETSNETIRAAAYILGLFEVVIARAYCGDKEGSPPNVDAGVCHIVALAIPYSTFCAGTVRGLDLNVVENPGFAGAESLLKNRCFEEARDAPEWVASLGVFSFETTNTTEPYMGIVREHYASDEGRSMRRLERLLWIDDMDISGGRLPEPMERDWMYRLQVRHLGGQASGSHTASTFLDEPYEARLHGFYWAFTTFSVDMRSKRLFGEHCSGGGALCSDMAFISNVADRGPKSWGILSQVLALEDPNALAFVPLSWSTASEAALIRDAVSALNFPASMHTTAMPNIPPVHRSPGHDAIAGPLDEKTGAPEVALRAALMNHHIGTRASEEYADNVYLKLYVLEKMLDTFHIDAFKDYLASSPDVVGFDYFILNLAHRRITYLNAKTPATKASRLYEIRIYYDKKRDVE